jgi:hypothetical protein
MVVVAVELSRLLRRALFVGAVAVAGWLLSLVFASAASADELPPDDTQNHRAPQSSASLLGGLVGGLTDTLAGTTDKIVSTLVDTSNDILLPGVMPTAQDPVLDLPSILPVGSSSPPPSSAPGNSSTDDQVDPLPAQSTAAVAATPVPPAAAPASPPAPTPPAPVVEKPAPKPAVSAPAPPPPAAQDQDRSAAEKAGKGVPDPQPVKTPSAPAGFGTTAGASHDSPGGARGTHGVLPGQTTLHPADAGFTTRSRATNSAGRGPGLPASSPD